MKKQDLTNERKRKGYLNIIIVSAGILLLLVIAYYVYALLIQKESVIEPAFAQPVFAVIPSSPVMCDSEDEYISDGLHDAVVNELGSINSVLVNSISASERYRDSELSSQQIGDDLGANYLIIPRVDCMGTGESYQTHIDVINRANGEVILSRTMPLVMEDTYTDIRQFIIQLAEELGIELSPEDLEYLNTARPVNTDMINLYEQGIFYMNKLTPEGFEKGQEFLKEAIAADPNDPMPYVGLALSYTNISHLSNVSEDAPRLAKEYAAKALELDPTQAKALDVLASGYFYEDWDWEKAEQTLKLTIELNPSIPSAHFNLGWYYALSGQWDKAAEELGLAVRIDPLEPVYISNLAALYFWMGDYEEAIVQAQNTLDINANFILGHWVMGAAYAELGRFDEAIEAHEKGIAIDPSFKHSLGVAYARAGRREEALGVADELEKLNYPAWYSWGLAEIYAALGDKDKAIQWVEAAYEHHQEFVPWYKSDPILANIQDDPRFIEIIDRLNLPG